MIKQPQEGSFTNVRNKGVEMCTKPGLWGLRQGCGGGNWKNVCMLELLLRVRGLIEQREQDQMRRGKQQRPETCLRCGSNRPCVLASL